MTLAAWRGDCQARRLRGKPRARALSANGGAYDEPRPAPSFCLISSSTSQASLRSKAGVCVSSMTGSRQSAPNVELQQAYPGDERIEARGQALAPGLRRCSHAPLRSPGTWHPTPRRPAGFWPFLTDFWWPLVEDRLDHEMICAATDLNLAQMLRGGTTSFYDCHRGAERHPGLSRRPGRGSSGARQSRHPLVRSNRAGEPRERPARAEGEPGIHPGLSSLADRGLVSGMMCYHTTFTCSAGFIRQAFDLARAGGDHRAHARLRGNAMSRSMHSGNSAVGRSSTTTAWEWPGRPC